MFALINIEVHIRRCLFGNTYMVFYCIHKILLTKLKVDKFISVNVLGYSYVRLVAYMYILIIYMNTY